MPNNPYHTMKAPHSTAADNLFKKHFGDLPRNENKEWLESLESISTKIDEIIFERGEITEQTFYNQYWSLRQQIIKELWRGRPHAKHDRHAGDPHDGYLYVLMDPLIPQDSPNIFWLGRAREPWKIIQRAAYGFGNSSKLIEKMAEFRTWAHDNELRGIVWAKQEALMRFEESIEHDLPNEPVAAPVKYLGYLWIPWKPIASSSVIDLKDGLPRKSLHTEYVRSLRAQGHPLLNGSVGRPKDS